jgi:hypothetical protein
MLDDYSNGCARACSLGTAAKNMMVLTSKKSIYANKNMMILTQKSQFMLTKI